MEARTMDTQQARPVSLKLKALLIVELSRGTAPRDAMDKVQERTRKEYSRDELRDAADAAIAVVKARGKEFWWMEFV